MRVGAENKRQVHLLAILGALVIGMASFELYGSLASPRVPSVGYGARIGAGSQHAATESSALSEDALEPKLRLHQLARTEQVEYSSSGRNIFSVESVPVHIETPLAPPRPVIEVAAPAPLPPKAPAIDVKYLGYTQTPDKTYSAILVRGDDSLSARSGEVIFHRFKVGSILPASVQLTDLTYNDTQTIIISDK